jgi:hypothetical protein
MRSLLCTTEGSTAEDWTHASTDDAGDIEDALGAAPKDPPPPPDFASSGVVPTADRVDRGAEGATRTGLPFPPPASTTGIEIEPTPAAIASTETGDVESAPSITVPTGEAAAVLETALVKAPMGAVLATDPTIECDAAVVASEASWVAGATADETDEVGLEPAVRTTGASGADVTV